MEDQRIESTTNSMAKENHIHNRNELEFAIFCIESVAYRLEMEPEKLYDVLAEKSNLLYNYIIPSYDVLHTQGKDYIVDDIISVLSERGVL